MEPTNSSYTSEGPRTEPWGTPTSNSTMDNKTEACYNPEENPVFRAGVITLYCIIFLASIIGNTLIILTVRRNPHMHSAVNLFIANMAASDILQAIFGVPRVIIEVLHGRESWLIGGKVGIFTCKLVYFIQDTSLSVSVISLIVITVERFYAVIFPLQVSLLRKNSKIIIPVIWILGASLHAIYFRIFTLYENAPYPLCYQKWSSPKAAMVYYTVIFAGIYCLALIAILIMYTLIIARIQHKKSTGAQESNLRKSREAQERKIFSVAVAITVVFFACFCPQTVLVIVAPLNAIPLCHIEALRFVTKVMEQTYSAVNPILCIIFSLNYREGFISIISRVAGRTTSINKSKRGELPREMMIRDNDVQTASNSKLKESTPRILKTSDLEI